MFQQVNGLFGWVDSNNKRSLLLFSAFILLFHLLGLVMLTLPLGLFATDYAPFFGWSGYFTTTVPLLTLAGVLIFGVQYFWQVKVIRKSTNFSYVDNHDEPRLCRIVEPLIITAGIPTPFIGVIEASEMNAFACGISQKNAVIVVTRGLINGLDDDELAAVLAHEIAHIKDGDIRLMAVANVCVSSVGFLFKRREEPGIKNTSGLLITVMWPAIFVLVLLTGFVYQMSFWLSYATRLAISSAREFIADAEAVRLTQNPSALISALQKIEGQSKIENLAKDCGSMMIDGDAEGESASHPRIAERIAAIIRTTGNLALSAPTRRDTRYDMPNGRREAMGFGRRVQATNLADLDINFGEQKHPSVLTLLRRVAKASPYNIFGLAKRANIILFIWVAIFLGINNKALASPHELAGKFSLSPLANLAKPMQLAAKCQASGIVMLATGELSSKKMPAACDELERPEREAEAAQMKREEAYKVGIVTERLCFATIAVIASGAPEGDEPKWPLDRVYEGGSHISAKHYAEMGDEAGSGIDTLVKGPLDAESIKTYVSERQVSLKLLQDYYGEPGVLLGQAKFAKANHLAISKRIAETLKDREFVASQSPLDLAELRLLADHPESYIPCRTRLGHALRLPKAPRQDPMQSFGLGTFSAN